MSFSREVKVELFGNISNARHCAIAELAAIISVSGQFKEFATASFAQLLIITENNLVATKSQLLIEKIFGFKVLVQSDSNIYSLLIENEEDTIRICNTLKMTKQRDADYSGQLIADNLVTQMTCCKRAFIRGAFLASGSVSNPEKAYHLEVVFQSQTGAIKLQDIIRSFFIEARIVRRKRYYVVYIKEGSQIVDLLNIMEAHIALMELENIRILKELRNSVNRQVNCETANIHKTVTAAKQQIDDILLIRDKIGFENLSQGLFEIADLRITNPDATLKELGEMLTIPIGKSGVNHRLKKLSSIADRLRG